MSTSKRGFASMTVEQRKEIASKGGKAAHAQGKAHKYTQEEATSAGRLGGIKMAQNREHMARIGRAGGKAAQANRLAREAAAATPLIPDAPPADEGEP